MASKKPPKSVPFNETSPERRGAPEILAATRQALDNTKRGLQDIIGGDPARFISGLHNVAVFGRSVTLGLQRLRNVVEGFDEWYKPRIPEKDPLLVYFNDFRNKILKEVAPPNPLSFVHFEHFSGHLSEMLQGPPPKGATGIFLFEGNTGGSGWTVRLLDGSEGKYYAALSPAFRGSVETKLPNPPKSFLEKELPDQSVAALTTLYVDWLSGLVADAERQFNQP